MSSLIPCVAGYITDSQPSIPLNLLRLLFFKELNHHPKSGASPIDLPRRVCLKGPTGQPNSGGSPLPLKGNVGKFSFKVCVIPLMDMIVLNSSRTKTHGNPVYNILQCESKVVLLLNWTYKTVHYLCCTGSQTRMQCGARLPSRGVTFISGFVFK